jgi:hypothetical protein
VIDRGYDFGPDDTTRAVLVGGKQGNG